jgi:hypothetical protein
MINALLVIQGACVNNVICLTLEEVVFTQNHLNLNAMNVPSINLIFIIYIVIRFFLLE